MINAITPALSRIYRDKAIYYQTFVNVDITGFKATLYGLLHPLNPKYKKSYIFYMKMIKKPLFTAHSSGNKSNKIISHYNLIT